MVSRTLSKQGKTIVIELANDDGRAFVDAIAQRIKAGWVPAKTPVAKLVAALPRMSWNFIIKAFAPDELPAVLKLAMKDKRVHADLLRSVVTPELIAFFVDQAEGRQQYQQEDVWKALAFAAKKPAAKATIAATLPKLIAKIDDEGLAKQATRFVTKLGAPPKPTPAVPAKPAGTEADLLAAIAAEPGSDGPRRVYADWLLERGIGWGEYIVAACAGTDRGDLDRLERKHAKAWLAPIRPFIRSWSFERGLLSWVETDAQLFVQAAGAIADRAPRATLRLVGLARKTHAALARAPLGRFETVMLGSQRIADDGAALLASSPTLAGVEVLNLSGNPIGDAGTRAFASSPHLRTLRQLDLENGLSGARVYASVDTLAALLAAPGLRALATLSLNCASEGLAHALARCKAPLESLRVVTARLSDADADALVAMKPRFSLVILGDMSARAEAAIAPLA